jgi:hypothetical protein
VAVVFTRSLAAPPLVAWFLLVLLFRSPGIPLPWAALMGSLVTVGMLGSQLWSYKLLRGYRRMARGREHAARKAQ